MPPIPLIPLKAESPLPEFEAGKCSAAPPVAPAAALNVPNPPAAPALLAPPVPVGAVVLIWGCVWKSVWAHPLADILDRSNFYHDRVVGAQLGVLVELAQYPPVARLDVLLGIVSFILRRLHRLG